MGSGIIVIEAGLYASNFPVQYYNKEKLAFIKLDFFKSYGQEKFFKEEDAKIIDKKSSSGKVLGYDSQMRYLQATQKNSKLAGIGKLIDLSRCEIEWLDTKLDKASVDMIITDPPRISKNRDEKKTIKLYNELFYQGDYVLKKKGTITLFGRWHEEIEKAAEKHKFKIIEKHALYQGKECFDVLIFKRKEVEK
jgi:23S rRNA G2445 N2-methylase RlmL